MIDQRIICSCNSVSVRPITDHRLDKLTIGFVDQRSVSSQFFPVFLLLSSLGRERKKEVEGKEGKGRERKGREEKGGGRALSTLPISPRPSE